MAIPSSLFQADLSVPPVLPRLLWLPRLLGASALAWIPSLALLVYSVILLKHIL